MQLEAAVSGVMMLLGCPTSWKEAQVQLASQDLHSRLLAVDAARMDDVTTRKLGRTMDAAKLSSQVRGSDEDAQMLVAAVDACSQAVWC